MDGGAAGMGTIPAPVVMTRDLARQLWDDTLGDRD